MADSVEGSVVGEKQAMETMNEEEIVSKNTAEQISCPPESVAEKADVGAMGDGVEADQVTQEAEKKVPQDSVAAEEASLPEESNLPVASSDEVVSEPSCEDVRTDTTTNEPPSVENIVTETVTEAVAEAAEDSSEQSSKKRKPEDDDLCADETKKLRTEDTPADKEEPEKSSNEAAGVAQEEVQLNEVSTPEETETNNKEIENMDTEVAVEAAAAAADSNIPVECQITTNEAEGVAEAAQEDAEVLNQQQDDKDSSENKENVISETVSNGATEPVKSVESAEEESSKVPAAKTLDEIEAPIEAEAVSS